MSVLDYEPTEEEKVEATMLAEGLCPECFGFPDEQVDVDRFIVCGRCRGKGWIK